MLIVAMRIRTSRMPPLVYYCESMQGWPHRPRRPQRSCCDILYRGRRTAPASDRRLHAPRRLCCAGVDATAQAWPREAGAGVHLRAPCGGQAGGGAQAAGRGAVQGVTTHHKVVLDTRGRAYTSAIHHNYLGRHLDCHDSMFSPCIGANHCFVLQAKRDRLQGAASRSGDVAANQHGRKSKHRQHAKAQARQA